MWTGAGAWSWLICTVAAGLVVWSVLDFIGVQREKPLSLVHVPAAELRLAEWPTDAAELHRLLPDATTALGRPVRVDGTVVEAWPGAGYWIRDLRDNVVFVVDPAGRGAGAAAEPPGAGQPVMVLGVVALLTPSDPLYERLATGPAVPPHALVVRDVKVVPVDGGLEVLRD